MSEHDEFSALPSMAGYDYQIRQAVLRLFDLPPGGALGIEILDDFHIEDSARHPETAVSVKLHATPTALTERSTDWWKSLRVWIEKACVGDQVTWPDSLLLLTSSYIQPGCLLEGLASKDHGSIEVQLVSIAEHLVENNKTLRAAAQSFLDMDSLDRREMLRRIDILSEQGGLAEISAQIDARLVRHTFAHEHCDQVRDFLIGHTWRIALEHQIVITEDYFMGLLRRLRDRFADRIAPLTRKYEGGTLPDEVLSAMKSKVFVRQLGMIDAPFADVSEAMRDYWNAVHQATYWKEHLEVLDPGLAAFENDLCRGVHAKLKPVRLAFERGSAKGTKEEAGLDLYYEVLQWDCRSLDGRVAPLFFQQGWFHYLADAQRLGWHPEFEELLRSGGVCR